MKIVVHDGHTIDPGNLRWHPFESVSEITVYDKKQPEEVIKRVGSAQVVFLSKVLITKEVIAACPNVQYIGLLST